MTENDEPRSTCPRRLGPGLDCVGNQVHTTSICNGFMPTDWFRKHCDRYCRMADLQEAFPEMRAATPPCCEEYRQLFLSCAEACGCLIGALDIRIGDHDGKMVWRNFKRVKFDYCPYCGKKLSSSEEDECTPGLL